MMKRITAFCLCICLGTVLFGCDEKETQEKKEKILWCGEPSKMVEENSETEKYLEKKYNIEIEIANVKIKHIIPKVLAICFLFTCFTSFWFYTFFLKYGLLFSSFKFIFNIISPSVFPSNSLNVIIHNIFVLKLEVSPK